MKIRSLTKKQKDILFVVSLLAFPIIQWLVFWLYLNSSSILMAFKDPITEEFTFYNFELFFRVWEDGWANDKGLKIAFINTLLEIGIGNFYRMPLDIFFSYVLFKKYYGHSVFRAIFYLPVIFGEVAVTIMQSYILDATGPIVMMCNFLGIKLPFEILQTGFYGNYLSARPTYFLTRLWAISGGTVLLLSSSLNRVPTDLFDSGKIDGCGFFREFFNIAFPLIWSTVGITWIMGFVGGWLSYSRVMLLTNGMYNTTNLGYYLMSSVLAATTTNGSSTSYNYPAAVGLIFTCFLCPLAIVLRKFAYKWITPVEY